MCLRYGIFKFYHLKNFHLIYFYLIEFSWITNTYYFDMNQNIPKSEIERKKNEIKYYQWVAFVLLIQALLFYMPRIFWRTVSLKAGLNISDLVINT